MTIEPFSDPADELRALLEEMGTWSDISAEEWGQLFTAIERARAAGPLPADCLWVIAERGWDDILTPWPADGCTLCGATPAEPMGWRHPNLGDIRLCEVHRNAELDWT